MDKKLKQIYCTECLAPLIKIKSIYKDDTNDLIDIHFICTSCDHISTEVIIESDIRMMRIEKLIN